MIKGSSIKMIKDTWYLELDKDIFSEDLYTIGKLSYVKREALDRICNDMGYDYCDHDLSLKENRCLVCFVKFIL